MALSKLYLFNHDVCIPQKRNIAFTQYSLRPGSQDGSFAEIQHDTVARRPPFVHLTSTLISTWASKRNILRFGYYTGYKNRSTTVGKYSTSVQVSIWTRAPFPTHQICVIVSVSSPDLSRTSWTVPCSEICYLLLFSLPSKVLSLLFSPNGIQCHDEWIGDLLHPPPVPRPPLPQHHQK